jgi:hypothetical protein
MTQDYKVIVPTVAGGSDVLKVVVAGLSQQGITPYLAELFDRTENDPRGANWAYYDLLHKEWKATSRDTVIVEHDIIVWPGLVQDMLACQAPWCTTSVLIHGKWNTFTFGCVKFGSDFKCQFPELFTNCRSKEWHQLDVWFLQQTEERDLLPCVHLPGVVHLNPGHQPRSADYVSNQTLGTRLWPRPSGLDVIAVPEETEEVPVKSWSMPPGMSVTYGFTGTSSHFVTASSTVRYGHGQRSPSKTWGKKLGLSPKVYNKEREANV